MELTKKERYLKGIFYILGMVYQDNVSTIKVLVDVRKKLQILKQEKGLNNVSEVILDLIKRSEVNKK